MVNIDYKGQVAGTCVPHVRRALQSSSQRVAPTLTIADSVGANA
jgi:hypothetical protein